MNTPVETTFKAPLYLARLAEANHIYCSFEPLAELVEGRWIDIDDRAVRFPRGAIRGKPAELGHGRQIGSFWVFTTDTFRTDTKTSSVSKPSRAIPLIDLSGIGLTEARKRLVESGVPLPEHQERMAVVLLEGGLYAYLKFGPAAQRSQHWTARLAEGRVELCSAAEGWAAGAEMRSGRYLPILGEPTGQVVRTEDWSTEAEFLARVADVLAGAARALGILIGPGADPTARRVGRAIADPTLTSKDAQAWASIIERLRSDWPRMSLGAEAVRSIGSLILDSEAGRNLLELAIERRVQALSKDMELRAQLEAADRFAPAKAELGRLEDAVAALREQERGLIDRMRARTEEIESATRAVEAKNSEIQKARREAAALARSAAAQQASVEAARTTLLEMQEGAAREAARAEKMRLEIVTFGERLGVEFEAMGSDESGRLAALAGRLQAASGYGSGGVIFPPSSPPWWGERPIDVSRISLGELVGRLREEAEAHGVAPEDLLLVDAFARSGELVVLTGEVSELVLEAYSRAVGGGSVRTVPVDPGVIGVDDLWRTPATAKPTALAWAWHRALSTPDRTFLVCLRGVDMSPARAWIPAFAAALHSSRRPRNLLLLATTDAREENAKAGDADSGEQRNSWIGRHAVGLRVKAGQDSGLAPAVRGVELPPATTLLPEKTNHEPSYKTLKALAAGNAPQVTRRAIRFLEALSATQSREAPALAAGWAKLLLEGAGQGLPAMLTGGYEDLLNARFLD